MLTQALVEEAMKRVCESERLLPAALAELQENKLRELVRFAVKHSPFYARHYKGIDPAHVTLGELPTVNKKLIQDHFDEVVTDPRLKLADVKAFCQPGQGLPGSPWFLGEFAVMLSSGTSGQRGYYVLDGTGLADVIAMGFRQSNRGPMAVNPPAPQRIAAVMLIEPFDAAGLLMRLIPEFVGPKRLIDIRQDFSVICAELDSFQPTLLSSFPYMLRMLCTAVEEGQLHIRPTRITSSGDVLTESDRRRIRASFGIDPHDYYCSTEASYMAWECDAHDGLHVNVDCVLVEAVDVANLPVPTGRLADRLLLTNLSNRAMPLIRYEMSDQVELMTQPCQCGCPLPRIRKVAGRIEHILSLPGIAGGRVALIPEHIDDFVGGLDDLTNYQVIQEGPAHLTVNFIPKPGHQVDTTAQAVREAFQGCFRRYGVTPEIHVEVRAVEQLEPIRPGANKVCHFWNRSEKMETRST